MSVVKVKSVKSVMKFITSKSLLRLRNLDLTKLDLSFLTEDEREVMERRLLGDSLETIGNAIGKSSQRVWQIERRACYRILRRNHKNK